MTVAILYQDDKYYVRQLVLPGMQLKPRDSFTNIDSLQRQDG